jgi:uncharacterized protein YbjQ (UPF0145 family)
MTTWTGKGLPPTAQARMRRFAESPVHSSLLTVPAAVAVDSVGFDPAGEVMGSAVMQLGWAGYGGCGYYGGYGSVAHARVYGSSSQWGGFAPYIKAVLSGYRLALNRLSAEASAMRADGIVGVRLSSRHLVDGSYEYTAIGSAVRARSRVRPDQPFVTDLDGPDFAALLIGGWVPVALEVAMEMAIRHDDALTRSQESYRRRANVEISGHTELAQYVRSSVRQKLETQIKASRAHGVVVSTLDFNLWGSDANGHLDHVAEARIFGTSIVPFRRGAKPSPAPLTMLVL